MRQVIYGARIFDGVSLLNDRALVIDGKYIVDLVPVTERPRGLLEHDLGGGILSPGFIDAQVNGGGGVWVNGTPTLEGIRHILEAHRRYGTTHALPTVITDDPSLLKAALEAGKQAESQLPGYLGLHVEGPFIDPIRAGAHPSHFIRHLTDSDVEELIAYKAGVMLVTLAPNKVPMLLIEKLAKAGIIVSLGHSEATDTETLAAIDAGASAVTHLFNAMSPLTHRAAGVVGATLSDPRVIAGMIADGHHVSPTAIRVALRAKGPQGLALVSDAMPPAADGPDRYDLKGRTVLKNGTRLALADGTLAGSAITLLDAVRYLVLDLQVEIESALQMATLTPARMLRVDHKFGRLAKGFSSSLVHLDDDLMLKSVWIDGLNGY
jgi:N-acetylglucosamine-6-phosphate deacetylase